MGCHRGHHRSINRSVRLSASRALRIHSRRLVGMPLPFLHKGSGMWQSNKSGGVGDLDVLGSERKSKLIAIDKPAQAKGLQLLQGEYKGPRSIVEPVPVFHHRCEMERPCSPAAAQPCLSKFIPNRKRAALACRRTYAPKWMRAARIVMNHMASVAMRER